MEQVCGLEISGLASQEAVSPVLDARSYFHEQGVTYVLSGHSAGSFYGFCADSMYHVEIMSPTPGEPEEVDQQMGYSYTEQLYFDEEASVPYGTSGSRVTGKLQTLMDMIHSGNDVARTDEALQVYLEEGESTLDKMVAYFREHGLTEEEISFALEGLDTDIT